MANWVDLPKDVLERISNFCIIPDQIRMQSPCKSWRSILKDGIPRELPWLMTLPNNSSSSSNSNSNKEEEEENPRPDAHARLFNSLSNKQKIHMIPLPGKHCCWSFQNGWLMIVDDQFNFCLFHPWSKLKIDLPHQSTFKDQIHGNHIVRSAMADDSNAVVVVFRYGVLAFCRVGDAAYTFIDIGIGIDAWIEDVIYHKGQFYALSQVGAAVYLLHIEEGFPPRGEKLTLDLDSPVCCFTDASVYLVADILTDNMFVITREVDSINQGFPVHETFRFEIYRVSLEQGSHDNMLKEFTKVESLGDRVLFLGYNSPMIVMACQFPGLKGNCIFFTDSIMDRYSYTPRGCPDLGVFSLEDGTVGQLFADRFHPTLSPPIWIAAPPCSYLRVLEEK